ncbi:thaumatin-like protein [Wolfiporia cocos MD-104 SS10]|uniref:Thaumatin-like protein n=1 Tax=Wolfiporia cocos (strain MD-104) TaxID=742152 RepID=A0A2H3J6V0_WOLCO|nr:thaumatin-like protein [Wolfiporia cocos MD-104 SS10]
MLAVLSVRTCARTFTVANDCPYTIWPAMFTGPSPKRAVPNYPAGWEAQPHTSVGFSVPNDWTAGRIWGRTDCDFSNDSASGQTCLTGWCIGGLLCNPTTGTGVPPATVAEWTLQGDNNKDYYDVSLVDGFNIPMEITNNAKCSTAECPADLNSLCPSALKGPSNSTGGVVGCQSSCDANLNDDKTNSPDCCTGSYSTAATCPSSGVQYYSFFKDNCPDSYAYAFDESSGTALWQCDSALNADYTLTFCP